MPEGVTCGPRKASHFLKVATGGSTQLVPDSFGLLLPIT